MTKWQSEFPYKWDQDDLVARRELLEFTVYTSGALFLAAIVLLVLGWRSPHTRSKKRKSLLPASALAPGEAHYFNYPEADDQAVLIRLSEGGFVAYSQRCTHLSCSVLYQTGGNRLYCPCHEGVFDVRTGEPLAGPPRRRLSQISLEQSGGVIYATSMAP